MRNTLASLCLAALVTSQPGSNNNQGSDTNTDTSSGSQCNTGVGDDATYTETLESNTASYNGTARRIVSSGCPNYPSAPINDNPNEAMEQDKNYTIEAYPCIADSTYSLAAVGSDVGITLNGISIFSPYAGVGTTDDAVTLEGDTFDVCSGHADPDGNYHYHVAPSCLLDQLDDYDNTTGHSPIIGWAFDGFPVYGPHGLDGSEIYPCGLDGSDNDDCLDSCNGHDQHEIDGYLYHYHITGPIGDLESSPTDPLPDSDMYPYTIGCLVGKPLDWDILLGEAGTSVCVSKGYVDGFEPFVVEGVTVVYGSDDDTDDDGDEDNGSSAAQRVALVSFFVAALAVIC